MIKIDPTKDCIIKLNTPIRSQEKDSWVIFQFSEKNGHQAIVSIVVRCTLFHERVCLIQEQHGVEVFSDLENGFKLLLKRIRISVIDNELACGYLRS